MAAKKAGAPPAKGAPVTMPKGTGARRTAPPRTRPAAREHEVVVKRTGEIDPKDPLASGTSAPLRKIWLDAAGQARDARKVVIDLVGEGRGVIAVPVAFDDERQAMEVMTPALDVLVKHCAEAGPGQDRPVMVDLQELRERLKLEPEEDWIAGHAWFHNALSSRELLCMYVFSPTYLLEFSVAIGDKQGFDVAISRKDAGFFELRPRKGEVGSITWNWARAIGDVIAGGHAWSYFGMLLALAPAMAEQQMAKQKRARNEEE
jgi:hypothetical protein